MEAVKDILFTMGMVFLGSWTVMLLLVLMNALMIDVCQSMPQVFICGVVL